MCETSMTGGWRCTPWGRKKSCPNLPRGCTTARVGPRSTASTNKKLRCAPTPLLKSDRSRELGFSTELGEHGFHGSGSGLSGSREPSNAPGRLLSSAIGLASNRHVRRRGEASSCRQASEILPRVGGYQLTQRSSIFGQMRWPLCQARFKTPLIVPRAPGPPPRLMRRTSRLRNRSWYRRSATFRFDRSVQ